MEDAAPRIGRQVGHVGEGAGGQVDPSAQKHPLHVGDEVERVVHEAEAAPFVEHGQRGEKDDRRGPERTGSSPRRSEEVGARSGPIRSRTARGPAPENGREVHHREQQGQSDPEADREFERRPDRQGEQVDQSRNPGAEQKRGKDPLARPQAVPQKA